MPPRDRLEAGFNFRSWMVGFFYDDHYNDLAVVVGPFWLRIHLGA